MLKFISVILPASFYDFLKSSIGKRFLNGSLWSFLSSLFTQLFLLMSSIIVARILGKIEFGELGIIRSTINMFAVFAGLSLGLTGTKYISEFKDKDKQRTGEIISITKYFAFFSGLLISILVFSFAPFLARYSLNAPHLVNEIRLSSLILFFSALNGMFNGILLGFEAFKTIAIVNFICSVIAIPLQIIMAYYFGIKGFLIGYAFNFFLLSFLYYRFVNKVLLDENIRVKFKFNKNNLALLYKFSLPSIISGLLITPVFWLCNTMLVRQPHGFNDFAIYTAANQWRMAIIFIPTVLAQVLLPMLSGSKNLKDFRKILKINFIISASVSLVIAIIISLFSKLIMRSYGLEFENGYLVLVILAFSTVLVALNNIIGQVLVAKGKMWIGLLFNFFWAIVLLTSSYFFLDKGYGALGLAYAFVISYLFHSILQIYYSYKYLLVDVK